MSRIHRLDPVVADQIAAGEVVERPASVVKELVENALDAGASRVAVAVEDGGLTRILVDDDGVGMDPVDLRLAVERHATSKIARLEDLDNLDTLGFRGEALAAISAVSRLSLESRTSGERVGWQVHVAHGVFQTEGPVARQQGTRVVAADLFQTLPARLKTLRTPAAELGQVQQVMAQMAVAYPAVAVSLAADGNRLFATPGEGSIEQAVAAVWGEDVVRDLLAVEAEALGGLVRVQGLAAPPSRARGNRQGQLLVVNGRIVRNFALRAAAEQAYGHLLGERRYPWFWLWLTVPGPDVDPNAHPAKAEVRLTRERAIAGLIHGALVEALRTYPAFPLSAAPSEARESPGPQLEWDAEPAAGPGALPVLHQEIAQLVPLAQWSARYVLAQGPAGLYLIDQHAAHERVYYDRLTQEAMTMTPSQPLLFPLSLTLTAKEWEAWEREQETLRAAGFEIDCIGGTTLAVRAVPKPLADGADLHLVSLVLESLSDDGARSHHPVSWARDRALATAACKAAVKSSRGLSHSEMTGLLEAMAASPSPRSCPHGRPTLLVLSLEEVDRRFGR